ncbi:unnamed protein product, partial [Ectocarpus sp. 12 AP-2014]
PNGLSTGCSGSTDPTAWIERQRQLYLWHNLRRCPALRVLLHRAARKADREADGVYKTPPPNRPVDAHAIHFEPKTLKQPKARIRKLQWYILGSCTHPAFDNTKRVGSSPKNLKQKLSTCVCGDFSWQWR